MRKEGNSGMELEKQGLSSESIAKDSKYSKYSEYTSKLPFNFFRLNIN